MSRRERKVVDLALAILRAQFQNRLAEPDRGPATRLALFVLLPYVGKHDLITFWHVMGNDNPLQRMNSLKKLYRLIEVSVMQADRKP